MPDRGVGAADSRGQATPSPDAVLFASYGTSREDARRASIEPVARRLREMAFGAETSGESLAGAIAGNSRAGDSAGPLFAEAYTSAKARRVLAGRGTPVPDVSEALHELARAGARRVLVQPGHLVYGTAFAQVEQAVAECRFLFSQIALGKPLLASDEDLAVVAGALAKRHPRRAGEAIVLVAHGVEGERAEVGSLYASLGLHLCMLGRDDMFVGSMNGHPGKDTVLRLLENERERLGVETVRLVPLMLTAAAHASRDINGTGERSWRSAFEAAGYEVACDLEGLGALPEVRELYAAHALAAWNEVREADKADSSVEPAGVTTRDVPVDDGAPVAKEAGAAGEWNAAGEAPSGRHLARGREDAPADAPSDYPRFPLFVSLANKRCLVVGLGGVGLRRARILASFGAHVVALDPDPSGEDVREAAGLGVEVERREWVPADLADVRLVVCATNRREVNAVIARSCRMRDIPVSVADSAGESTFFFPAVCTSERLVAGVVSHGEDHALVARAAARVRETLGEVDR